MQYENRMTIRNERIVTRERAVCLACHVKAREENCCFCKLFFTIYPLGSRLYLLLCLPSGVLSCTLLRRLCGFAFFLWYWLR